MIWVVTNSSTGSFVGVNSVDRDNFAFRCADCVVPAFLAWIGEQAAADSIDPLLFLEPGGHTLYELGRVDSFSDTPRAWYVHGSPVSLVITALTDQNFTESLPQMVAGAKGLRLDNFFLDLRVPLPTERFLRDIGFSGETLIEPSIFGTLTRFLYAYRWEILKVARKRRHMLFQEFLNIGIADGMRIGIVQLGWNKSAEALISILNNSFDAQVYQYCFWLGDDPESLVRRAAIPTSAFISGDHFPVSMVKTVQQTREVIEDLFAAKTGRLPVDKVMTPIPGHNRELYEQLAMLVGLLANRDSPRDT